MTNMYINKTNRGWLSKWTPEEDEIVKNYYPQYGSKEVIKYLPHRNRNAIKTRAAKLGVKYLNYNKYYFDVIDTPTKAYWLGFLYSDGYVTTNNRWGLELQIGDIEHLQKLVNELDSNIKIKTRERNGYKSCFIQISNSHMCNSLMTKGVIRNKTSILTFPTEEILKKEIYSHFIRGFFDGDGCVCTYKNKANKKYDNTYSKNNISIVCKNDKFIKKILEILYENGIYLKFYINKRDNLPTIQSSNIDTIKSFYQYLYNNSNSSNRLNRKYEKMSAIISCLLGG